MEVKEIKKIDILATVELTETEMRGLVKMIGPTSYNSRIENNLLTERESQTMEDVYNQLSKLIGEI